MRLRATACAKALGLKSKECPVAGRALPSGEELGCCSKAYQQRNDLSLGGAGWVGVALSRS